MKYVIAGASVRGSKHIKKGVVCQDAIAYYENESDSFYSIALADGAGSQKYSDVGAQFISEFILKYIYSHFNEIYTGSIDRYELTYTLEKALYQKAKKIAINYETIGSTLLAVCVKGDKLISIHIGDGVIAYKDINEKIHLLSHPMNGEFKDQTFFTNTNFKDKLRLGIVKIEKADSFILMSDGLSDSLYIDKDRSMVYKTTNLLFEKLNHLGIEEANKWYEQFILHSIFEKRTGDDISLIVMSKAIEDTKRFDFNETKFLLNEIDKRDEEIKSLVDQYKLEKENAKKEIQSIQENLYEYKVFTEEKCWQKIDEKVTLEKKLQELSDKPMLLER